MVAQPIIALIYWVCIFSPWRTTWAAVLLLTYTAWFLFFDDAAFIPRRSGELATNSWWNRYADFFPVTLVKTAEIAPDRSSDLSALDGSGALTYLRV